MLMILSLKNNRKSCFINYREMGKFLCIVFKRDCKKLLLRAIGNI